MKVYNRDKICNYSDCPSTVIARGMCYKHYQAVRFRERKEMQDHNARIFAAMDAQKEMVTR